MHDPFTIYAAYRNYMRPKFWGTHRSDPECARKSPSMEIGITQKILSFSEFFYERVKLTPKKHQYLTLSRIFKINIVGRTIFV